jgi:hypothetical protein
MNQFQLTWAKLSNAKEGKSEPRGRQPESDEDATMRMANQLLRPVLGRELTKREEQIGGPGRHGRVVWHVSGAVATFSRRRWDGIRNGPLRRR